MSDLSGNWTAWKCIDCDPARDYLGNPKGFEKPYVMLLPEGVEPPDCCLRCGSYLSFDLVDKKLQITNTVDDRDRARRAEKSGGAS